MRTLQQVIETKKLEVSQIEEAIERKEILVGHHIEATKDRARQIQKTKDEGNSNLTAFHQMFANKGNIIRARISTSFRNKLEREGEILIQQNERLRNEAARLTTQKQQFETKILEINDKIAELEDRKARLEKEIEQLEYNKLHHSFSRKKP